MSVNLNESFLSQKASDYAMLSELAYANWKQSATGEWVLVKGGALDFDYARYEKLWEDLKTRGYTFVNQSPSDDPTGFSATVFQKDGSAILAIRGTNDVKDISADSELVSRLPYQQFESLVKYISLLNLTNFDVTGHSLGGFLAQVAKAAFPNSVQNVYTYNAPGAKGLLQYTQLGIDPLDGKVVVLLPGVNSAGATKDLLLAMGYAFKWDQSTWNAYSSFVANQNSAAVESKIYSISGKDGLSGIAETGKDIGLEVFIPGLSHEIKYVTGSISKYHQYYIDPRKPVPFIGRADSTSRKY